LEKVISFSKAKIDNNLTQYYTKGEVSMSDNKKYYYLKLKENKQKGIRTILQVFKDNPAKSLYEKLGFKVYGETETHYQMENVK